MTADVDGKLRLGVTGGAEVSALFEQLQAGARRVRSTIGSEFRSLKNDIGGLASDLGKLATPLAGIGLGAGLAMEAKGVLEFRSAVVAAANAANMSGDQIAAFRKEITATSVATQQMGKDLAEGLQEFVAKTGDIDAARKNLELYGRVATATGSAVKEIASVGAELQKLGITDQKQALAILASQSDVGSVELKDLVSQGPRLVSAAQAAGLRGTGGLREIGALAQVTQTATGNVERTSTSVEAVMRDIAMKAPQLQEAGISVFDKKTGESKDRVQVLLDIIRKAQGKEQLLRRVFGDEAMRAVNPLATEFRKTGGFGTFEKFRDIGASEDLIDKKFALMTSTGTAATKAAQIRMLASTETEHGDQIEEGVKKASGAAAGMYEFGSEHPFLTIGGALLGKQLLKRGPGLLKGLLGGKGGGGGLARDALGRFIGAGGGGGGGDVIPGLSGGGGDGVPVQVTNWPEEMGAGGGGSSGLGTAAKTLLGGGATVGGGEVAAGGLGAGLGTLLLPLTAVLTGISAQVATLIEIGENRDVMGERWRAEHQSTIAAEEAMRAEQQRVHQSAVEQANAAATAAAAVDSSSIVGRYGGGITADQVGAARVRGKGAFAYSPEATVEMFGRQQALLRALAGGYEAGLGDQEVGAAPDDAYLVRSLRATVPAFANATGTEKGQILRELAAANERDAARASIPEGLRAPAGDEQIDVLGEIRDLLKQDRGGPINITIGADGQVTATGARAPGVMVRRAG